MVKCKQFRSHPELAAGEVEKRRAAFLSFFMPLKVCIQAFKAKDMIYFAEIHAESELIRFGSFINTGPIIFKKHDQ